MGSGEETASLSERSGLRAWGADFGFWVFAVLVWGVWFHVQLVGAGALPLSPLSLELVSLGSGYLRDWQAMREGFQQSTSLFPAQLTRYYSDSSLLPGVLFAALRAQGWDEIRAYAGIAALVWGTNAAGYFALGKRVARPWLAAVAALVFSGTTIWFARAGEVPAASFGVAMLAMDRLLRWRAGGRTSDFLVVWAWLALQAWISGFGLLHGGVGLFVIALHGSRGDVRRLGWWGMSWRTLVGALLFALFAGLYVAFHAFTFVGMSVTDPWGGATGRLFGSLRLDDLVRQGEGVLFAWNVGGSTNPVHAMLHVATPGLVVVALGVWGLWQRAEVRVWRWVAVAGLIGGISAPIAVFGMSIPTPMSWVMDHVPYAWVIREPVRFVSLTVVALQLGALAVLESLLSRRGDAGRVAVVVGALVVTTTENVPWRLPVMEPLPLRLNEHYLRAMSQVPGEFAVLDLPTGLPVVYGNFSLERHLTPIQHIERTPGQASLEVTDVSWASFAAPKGGVAAAARERLYMIWQTQHRKNTSSGIATFPPTSRLIYQRIVEELPDVRVPNWLSSHGAVSHIAFHKRLATREELYVLQGLRLMEQLKLRYEDADHVLFEIGEPIDFSTQPVFDPETMGMPPDFDPGAEGRMGPGGAGPAGPTIPLGEGGATMRPWVPGEPLPEGVQVIDPTQPGGSIPTGGQGAGGVVPGGVRVPGENSDAPGPESVIPSGP